MVVLAVAAAWWLECSSGKRGAPTLSVAGQGDGLASSDQGLATTCRCCWQCQQWPAVITGHPQKPPAVLVAMGVAASSTFS